MKERQFYPNQHNHQQQRPPPLNKVWINRQPSPSPTFQQFQQRGCLRPQPLNYSNAGRIARFTPQIPPPGFTQVFKLPLELINFQTFTDLY